MTSMKAVGAAVFFGVMTAALAGCDRGAASAPARDHAADSSGGGAYARNDRYSDRSGRGGDSRRREPVPMFHGEPMWSDNSRHTARENAEYHFQRSGTDLGAKNLDDFLTRVHRFVDHPPAGALHMARANGDRLLYDPKSNIFAVVRRDGAPRTVFKPTDGMAYWKEQQAREASGGDRGSYRRGGYSGGGYGRSSYGASDR